MSNNDTNTASTNGGTTNEPITKEFFLGLTPATFEALPRERQKAVVQWLVNHPHRLDGRPQSTTKKETK